MKSVPVKAYAAPRAGAALAPFQFEPREPGDHDVVIDIRYCGVCHSDIHQARDEWGGSIFPMVPGHEIVGSIERVGAAVQRFKPGDTAGVGCFVDSCRDCPSCKKGLQQYCAKGMVLTYNGEDYAGRPTYGGYASQIVVDEHYALKVPAGLPLERVAPLLCAGITTYSPIKHWGMGKGHRVGVMGLGGLGHMAVKLAAAHGAEVTVFSTHPGKAADAKKLGAHAFVLSTDDAAMSAMANRLDFILNTVSATHDLNRFLPLLYRDGVLVMLGAPPAPLPVEMFNLIMGRRSLAGSVIGGIPETQDMLDFCAAKNALADVEVIPIQKINEAYERVLKGDVRYRFVIDLSTLP